MRERKKARTWDTLQAAARRLVAERGYDHVTTEDIAAEAEVSKSTLFNYFGSKEAVLVDVHPDRLTQMAALLDARPVTETPLQALRAAQTAGLTFEALTEVHALGRLALSHPALQLRLDHQFAAFDGEIKSWVSRRYPTSCPNLQIYPELIASVAASTMRVLLRHWEPEAGRDRAVETIDAVYAHYSDGLLPH